MRLKLSILFFFTIISFVVKAEKFGNFQGCGEYQVAGIFKINERGTGFHYVVHEGSKSEILISLKLSDESKIAPYIDRPSIVHAHFSKIIDKQRGEFTIVSVKSRIPDPLQGPKDSGFTLLKETKCL